MHRFCCKKYNFSLISTTTLLKPAKTELLQDRFESLVVNAKHRFSTSFAAMLQNKLHVFVARLPYLKTGVS